VVVQGVFLDDLQQDTLLAAGSVKVAVALRELLFKRINVSSISLEDVSLHLSREPADSMFNYYFLIAAFTDTTAPPPGAVAVELQHRPGEPGSIFLQV
jgi:translocation and assembly module TamB